MYSLHLKLLINNFLSLKMKNLLTSAGTFLHVRQPISSRAVSTLLEFLCVILQKVLEALMSTGSLFSSLVTRCVYSWMLPISPQSNFWSDVSRTKHMRDICLHAGSPTFTDNGILICCQDPADSYSMQHVIDF